MAGLVVEGIAVEELVQAIHDGLRDTGLDSGVGQGGLVLSRVALELKAVVEKTVGLKPKFVVPFVGWEVGGGFEVTDSHVQTIKVALVPPWAGDDEADREPLAGNAAQLAESLPAAVATIREVLDVSTSHDLGLRLDNAEIALKFEVTEDKKIELAVPSASWKDPLTNTVTFSFDHA